MKLTAHYVRKTSFAVTIICLVVWMTGAGAMLMKILNAAQQAQMPRQRNLLNLAYLLMAVLALSLVLLVAVLARYIKSRLNQPPEKATPLGHVDAWAEAPAGAGRGPVADYLELLTDVDPGDDPVVLPPLVTVVAQLPIS